MPGPTQPAVNALLLLAPGCPHCAGMLESLSALVKDGAIARLEVVNLASEPSVARELGIRSVPWTRIGPFELAGLHTCEELRHWVSMAARDDGMSIYFADLLATGKRAAVADRLRREPDLLETLVDLLGDPEQGLSVRIGVMATLEELQDSRDLGGMVTRLVPMLSNAAPRVRADACHALALTRSQEALRWLEKCGSDPDPEVRETAAEGITQLRP